MRITTGIHKGRLLSVPPGNRIRPTGDKMRQAVFNILQQYDLPVDAQVVDAFCGTGALGLEALSRGAAYVTFLDLDIDCCLENVEKLKAQPYTAVMRRDATNPGKPRAPANLLFLDPPYGQNLVNPALTALAQNGWLAPGAVAVCEAESEHAGDIPAGFVELDRRSYGAALLLLLRYTG